MTKSLRKPAPDADVTNPEIPVHVITEKITGKFIDVFLRDGEADKLIRGKGADRINYNIITILRTRGPSSLTKSPGRLLP